MSGSSVTTGLVLVMRPDSENKARWPAKSHAQQYPTTLYVSFDTCSKPKDKNSFQGIIVVPRMTEIHPDRPLQAIHIRLQMTKNILEKVDLIILSHDLQEEIVRKRRGWISSSES